VPVDSDTKLIDDLPPVPRALAREGQVRRYRKNVLLISEGDQSDVMFVLLRGRVRAFSMGASDREITFATDGPGGYFGEMSLDGGPRSASVVTLEPCVCSVVQRATALRLVAENPEVALHLLRSVIGRARFATDSARNLALHDVYGRLIRVLDDMAQSSVRDGTRLLFERLTHLELARRIGASREMVSRVMKDLQRGGYIEVRAGGIVLLKPLPERW
jgi:CRP/FNR family transcriptional regulator, cyclic AMP receptor protein